MKTFTISGTARIDGKAMEGVLMEGLPGNPITGSDGKYKAIVDYDWSGSAIPTKDGYVFTPNSKQYTAVTRDMLNENYTGAPITFTISGSAGIEGVTMKGLPGNPKTGRNGTYSVKVIYNWSGIVKPEKEGYTFEPAEMPYTNVTNVYLDEDYTANAITFTISGTAGIDGVEMKGLLDVFTDENGYYTASVAWGWGGTITPAKPGYDFDPKTWSYTKVNSDRTNRNYTPSPIILTISGSAGKQGVTMDGLPGNPVTGAGGLYSAKVDWGWTGTVTPLLDGYEFTPANRPYAAITTDQKLNYTVKVIEFTISGFVEVSGVTLKGFPGRPVMSKSDGTYSARVKYGWEGRVEPVKAGYAFVPSEILYPELFGDEANQDYTAALEKRTISGTLRSDKGEPVEGVFLSADKDGGSATTNANGQYELMVDYSWRGTITPFKEGYTFKPTNKVHSAPVTRDLANQVFTAIVRTFTISHTVTVGGTPITGVQVSANNGGGTTVTDSKGRFSVTVPYNWTGEIALSKEGFMFPSKSYTTKITENWKDDMPASQILPVRRATPTLTTTPTVTTPTVTAIVPEGPEFVGLVPHALPLVTEPNKPLTPLERIQQQLDAILAQQKGIVEAEPNVLVPKVTLISNVFVDDDLATSVLPAIASMAGVTIIPDETVVANVTCTLKDVPLETALDIVLGGTPYIWKKTQHYYLVCSGDLTSLMFSIVSETRRIKMNYVTATAAVGLLSSAFREYAQAETGLPGVDTYTVVVTAAPALMERIISDLKKIDHIRPAVLLDARIVVMERGNLLNLGVEWGWPRISFGAFGNDLRGEGTGTMTDFGGKIPWGLRIGYTPDATFTNALDLVLNLLAQNDEATIIANPQVLAQDGKVAEINVMTEEYYFMSGAQSAGYYYSYSQLEKISSGTKLSITPHIGDNNDITLELATEVSDSIPRGRESDLPVVTRRTAKNTVRIKDGGTVALAGLTENRTRTDKRRVPGLSKIPFIGKLFKNTNDQKSSREIAVFVTARIIHEQGQSVDFTQPQTPAIQAPIRPMEGDFRMRLRESLSRSVR